MLADVNLLFWGSSPYASVSNFTSLANLTNSSASTVINLGVAEDMGIGDGEAVPKVAIYVGTGFTSACTSQKLNFQFQGSTDSSNWTTYVETGVLATSSLTAGNKIFPIDVPHRPPGISLPQYYRINVTSSGNAASEAISAGSLWGGIVIQRDDNPVGSYPSGFVVV
jgi:hypothetical protein